MLEVRLLIDHVDAYTLALGVQLVHFDVLPSYVKVAVIDTDQSTVPELFLNCVVFFLVMVLEVARKELLSSVSTSMMIVS